MVSHGLQSLANAYRNSRLLAQTVFIVSISDKERLGANQSAGIRTEAQHCEPLRINPNFSVAAFHIRSIPDVLSISAADVSSQGELIVYPSSRRPSACVRPSVRPPFSKISSKTARPIKAKFYVQPPWEGRTKVCINGPGHMTKIAANHIHSKTLQKSSPPEPAVT